MQDPGDSSNPSNPSSVSLHCHSAHCQARKCSGLIRLFIITRPLIGWGCEVNFCTIYFLCVRYFFSQSFAVYVGMYCSWDIFFLYQLKTFGEPSAFGSGSCLWLVHSFFVFPLSGVFRAGRTCITLMIKHCSKAVQMPSISTPDDVRS